MDSTDTEPKATTSATESGSSNGGCAPLRSIQDIIADLSKPIPKRLLKDKTAGGRKIYFLTWHKAIKFLDLYAPGWSYTVQAGQVGNLLVATAVISIPCLEGVVSRAALGNENDDLEAFGDPSSNAEAQALKRAASKFGLGLYLYDLTDPNHPTNGR